MIFYHYRTVLTDQPYIESTFHTVEELFRINHLQIHSSREGFKSFCLKGDTLIAVYDDKLWFAGHIDKPESLNIPTMCQLCRSGLIPIKVGCKLV